MPVPGLTIRVVSYDGKPLDPSIAAEIPAEGGSIGRAPANTLVLPDPGRVISRQHATIAFRGGTCYLRDQGSAVPVQVNGRVVGNGREIAIGDGDEIAIGGYVMHVAIDDERTLDLPAGRIAADETIVASRPVLSWETRGERSHEGITRVVVPDATDAPVAATPADAGGSARTERRPVDPHAPVPEGATLPLGASSAAATPAASDEALLRAFLEGAGIPSVRMAGGMTPERMEQLGRVLREAIRGVLDLLRARAVAKRDVHAEGTIIVAKDNNPLKFSPDADAAFAALLTPRGHAFMAPEEALADAYAALSSHQQGFVAGMRAVLSLALARFDPQAFERRLPEPGVADSLLPMNRKAKLWDLFATLYVELSKESSADFHALFGPEFLRAYAAEVERARRESQDRERG